MLVTVVVAVSLCGIVVMTIDSGCGVLLMEIVVVVVVVIIVVAVMLVVVDVRVDMMVSM